MRQIPVLMYHWFRTDSSPVSSQVPHLEISPRLFEKQLRFLARKGYKTISIKQMMSDKATSPLPEKPIVLTFDDGTLDFREIAQPLLEKYGFKASIFVVSGAVGKQSTWDLVVGETPRQLMNWEHLKQLHHAGHEICSHSVSHRPFTDLTEHEIIEELVTSKDVIHHHMGSAPDIFAYPKGFYLPEHKKLVKNAGYIAACAVILHWKDLMSSDRFEIKRMTIRGTESMIRFRIRLVLATSITFHDKRLENE